jgi:leucyl aminopeptidase (aminopeptidase T)
MRYRLRTLMLIVALAAVCLTISRAYQFWYVRNYPLHSLNALVGAHVHNGDTFREVAKHFTKAVKVDFDKDPQVQMVWTSRGWTVLPGDEIWRFTHSRSGTTLQFREGRVVNFQATKDEHLLM